MSDAVIRELERTLADMHGRDRCMLLSRGAVALYLALKALGPGGGRVVIPSAICMSPPAVTLLAGLEPLYCDVSADDLNADPADVERCLRENDDVRAVLLVHMYGRPGDVEGILDVAGRHGVPVIEDAAQAVGGSLRERPLGSFGEFSVLSFGHTKILDVGGLGALLFDDERWLEPLRAMEAALPAAPPDGRLAGLYRSTYYALAPLARADHTLYRLYLAFPWIFEELYVHGGVSEDLAVELTRRLQELPEIVARRNENARRLRTLLSHPRITHLADTDEGVCWRYSFLVEGIDQGSLAAAVRARGVDVSNWYPPAHLMLEAQPPRLPRAERAADRVFNLWVDHETRPDELARRADVFLEAVDAHA